VSLHDSEGKKGAILFLSVEEEVVGLKPTTERKKKKKPPFLVGKRREKKGRSLLSLTPNQLKKKKR